ncbi:MAG: hypothetical protein Q7S23_01615 [bacterium]|nr:hypothetical protein [bacterium]
MSKTELKEHSASRRHDPMACALLQKNFALPAQSYKPLEEPLPAEKKLKTPAPRTIDNAWIFALMKRFFAIADIQ